MANSKRSLFPPSSTYQSKRDGRTLATFSEIAAFLAGRDESLRSRVLEALTQAMWSGAFGVEVSHLEMPGRHGYREERHKVRTLNNSEPGGALATLLDSWGLSKPWTESLELLPIDGYSNQFCEKYLKAMAIDATQLDACRTRVIQAATKPSKLERQHEAIVNAALRLALSHSEKPKQGYLQDLQKLVEQDNLADFDSATSFENAWKKLGYLQGLQAALEARRARKL